MLLLYTYLQFRVYLYIIPMRPSRIGALETMAIFVTVSESYTITVIYDTQCNIIMLFV